ncbi:MAG: hypothetical protein IJT30_03035 [Muribaculaceae bacterium]|nr:hypothetical protein [Muribaculaceae bacterium]
MPGTDNEAARQSGIAQSGASNPTPDNKVASNEAEHDAPREFYSRFFLRLDAILLALLALLWMLNQCATTST